MKKKRLFTNTLHRREEILNLISQNEFCSTSQLSSIWGVSEVSIRKDFEFLQSKGLIKRVHGGAVPSDDATLLFDLSEHYMVHRTAKTQIAKMAVKFIDRPNMQIYIETGLTNLLLARAIPTDLPITIVTNSLSTITALEGRPNCRVISLGGEVDYHRKTLTGIWGNTQLDRLHFDITFTGADTVCEKGFGADDPIESETIRKAIMQSEKAYIACESSKINKPIRRIFATPSEVTGWITDPEADEGFVKKIRCLGGNVVIAGS